MSLTREQLEQRKADLAATLEQMKAALGQLEASIHANEGAIQDCDYWIAQLDAPAPLGPAPEKDSTEK
jgi:hypothetical protein